MHTVKLYMCMYYVCSMDVCMHVACMYPRVNISVCVVVSTSKYSSYLGMITHYINTCESTHNQQEQFIYPIYRQR